MQKEIMLNKKYSIAANAVLLLWFFLDMIGIYFENKYLVTRSWREDGIYFVIFLLAFLTLTYLNSYSINCYNRFYCKTKEEKITITILICEWEK